MIKKFSTVVLKKGITRKVAISVLPVLVIILGTLPAVSAIIKPGYFAMHDDLQAMRQLEMDKCFRDLQIPCRWVPDMGYGYGYPLFNYYPPMPYYLGEIFHLVGFSFLDTVKVLFVLVFVSSAFSMYLLTREFWGRIGGTVSALFYVWAPYHAVDVYVRGAMNEAWALVWFPAILWAIYKVIKTNKWLYVSFLAFFVSMLALSHNPLLMVFAPGAVIWVIFWFWQTRSLKSFTKLFVAGVWSIALAAFFTLPVIFEQKFAHIETLTIGYFGYQAHFVDLRQLFIDVNWGYGASYSYIDQKDTMSFHLGYLHWVLSIFSLIVAWFLRKKKFQFSLLIIFFFFWTYGYTFLTHLRSSLIWEIIVPLKYLQFPWRLLSLSMIGMSFLAGSFFALPFVKTKFSRLGLALALIVMVIFLNRNYFTWREFYPKMTDQEKFSGKLWELQRTSGIFDYLPIWAPMPPANPAPSDAEVLSGKGQHTTLKKVSNFQEYQVSVESDSTEFQINTLYFPGWEASVDSKKVLLDPARDRELGRMIVDLEKGNHQIVVKLKNTPIRTLGNYLSLIGWILLVGFFSLRFFRKFAPFKIFSDKNV